MARQEGIWGRNVEPSERGSPATPPGNFTGGTEQTFPFSFFEFFSGGARERKIARENFCEVAAGVIAEAGGGAGQSSGLFAKKVRISSKQYRIKIVPAWSVCRASRLRGY